MYTDVALKVLSEAGRLQSACELDGDVRDLVMTNRVLILYLVPFFGFSKNKELSNLPRYADLVRDVKFIDCEYFTFRIKLQEYTGSF
jgi:hypothetical protein